ncbi:UNVERIFIED_CONTAM: hypothetical protein HHA_239810 [Hammondia hammondi]|eukprot:XP_008887764.1 hypothetical protein HHA_239810 [Hammondia hammondi]
MAVRGDVPWISLLSSENGRRTTATTAVEGPEPPTGASSLTPAAERVLQAQNGHAVAREPHTNSGSRNVIARKRTSSLTKNVPPAHNLPSEHRKSGSTSGTPGSRRVARTRTYRRHAQEIVTERSSKLVNHDQGSSPAVQRRARKGESLKLLVGRRSRYPYIAKTGVSPFYHNDGAPSISGELASRGWQTHAQTRQWQHVKGPRTQSRTVSGVLEDARKHATTIPSAAYTILPPAHRGGAVTVHGFSDRGSESSHTRTVSTDMTGGLKGRLVATDLSSTLAEAGSDLSQLVGTSGTRHRNRSFDSLTGSTRRSVERHPRRKALARSTVAIYAFLCLLGFLRVLRRPSQLKQITTGVESGGTTGRDDSALIVVIPRSDRASIAQHNLLDKLEIELALQLARSGLGRSITKVADNSPRRYAGGGSGLGSSSSSEYTGRLPQTPMRTLSGSEAPPRPPGSSTGEAEDADSFGLIIHGRAHWLSLLLSDMVPEGGPTATLPVIAPPESHDMEAITVSTESVDRPSDSEHQSFPILPPGSHGMNPCTGTPDSAVSNDGPPDPDSQLLEIPVRSATQAKRLCAHTKGRRDCGRSPHSRKGKETARHFDAAASDAGDTGVGSEEEQDRTTELTESAPQVISIWPCGSENTGGIGFQPEALAVDQSVAPLPEPVKVAEVDSGETHNRTETHSSSEMPALLPEKAEKGRYPTQGRLAGARRRASTKRSPSHRSRKELSASKRSAREAWSGSTEPAMDDDFDQFRGSSEPHPEDPASKRTFLADSSEHKSATESAAVKPLKTEEALHTGHAPASLANVVEHAISGERVAVSHRSGEMLAHRGGLWEVGGNIAESEMLGTTETEMRTISAGGPVSPGPESSVTSPLTSESAEVATAKEADHPTDTLTDNKRKSSPVVPGKESKDATVPLHEQPGPLPHRPVHAFIPTEKTQEPNKLSQKEGEQAPPGGAPIAVATAAAAAAATAVLMSVTDSTSGFTETVASKDGQVVEVISPKEVQKGHRNAEPLDSTKTGDRSQPLLAVPVDASEAKTAKKPTATGVGQNSIRDEEFTQPIDGKDTKGGHESKQHPSGLRVYTEELHPLLLQGGKHESGPCSEQTRITRQESLPLDVPGGLWGADGAKFLIQQALSEELKSPSSESDPNESAESDLRFLFGLQWLGDAGERLRRRRRAQGKERENRDMRKYYKILQHLLSDISTKLEHSGKAGLLSSADPYRELHAFLATMFLKLKQIDSSLARGFNAFDETVAKSPQEQEREQVLRSASPPSSRPRPNHTSPSTVEGGNTLFRHMGSGSNTPQSVGTWERMSRRRPLTEESGTPQINEAYETALNMVFLLTKLRADLQVHVAENQMCALINGTPAHGAASRERRPPASSRELIATHRKLVTRILDGLAAGAKAVAKRRSHALSVIERVADKASAGFRSLARKYLLVLEGLHWRYDLQMQLYRNKLEMGPVIFSSDDPYPSLLPRPQGKEADSGELEDGDMIQFPSRRKRVNSLVSIEEELSNEFSEVSSRRTISDIHEGSPLTDAAWLEKDRQAALRYISNKRLSAGIHASTVTSIREYRSLQEEIGEFSGKQGYIFFPFSATEQLF